MQIRLWHEGLRLIEGRGMSKLVILPSMRLFPLFLCVIACRLSHRMKPPPAAGRAARRRADQREHFAGLRARSIGPAFVSGRVSQIAMFPDSTSHYLIAEASGGVWLPPITALPGPPSSTTTARIPSATSRSTRGTLDRLGGHRREQQSAQRLLRRRRLQERRRRPHLAQRRA